MSQSLIRSPRAAATTDYDTDSITTRRPKVDYFTQRAVSYNIRKEKYTGDNSVLNRAQREEAANIKMQRERIAELKNFKL